MSTIRVIDFETNGLEPPAEVCEAAICDIDVETQAVSKPESWLCGVDTMPPVPRSVHHIALSEVQGLPPFDESRLYGGATIIAAHNAEFECKFIDCPLPVLCTYKAALRIWPDAPSHSNFALRYWLEDQGKIIGMDDSLAQPAHRAGPDAYVTACMLVAMMNEGHTCREMVAWTKEPRMLPTCPIGKFRGKPWSEVEGGFLDWMLRQESMEADFKWNARLEIERRSKTEGAIV